MRYSEGSTCPNKISHSNAVDASCISTVAESSHLAADTTLVCTVPQILVPPKLANACVQRYGLDLGLGGCAVGAHELKGALRSDSVAHKETFSVPGFPILIIDHRNTAFLLVAYCQRTWYRKQQ